MNFDRELSPALDPDLCPPEGMAALPGFRRALGNWMGRDACQRIMQTGTVETWIEFGPEWVAARLAWGAFSEPVCWPVKFEVLPRTQLDRIVARDLNSALVDLFGRTFASAQKRGDGCDDAR